MPRVSEFYGIAIRINYRDHAPPHFHATYGEHEALIGIDPMELLDGRPPPRAERLVFEWARLH